MRKEFELTSEELSTLLDACKPTPCIMVGDYIPASPQENANRAWEALGKQKGFDPYSAKPVSGKSDAFFTAEVIENVSH
jgi:hypothetical protein